MRRLEQESEHKTKKARRARQREASRLYNGLQLHQLNSPNVITFQSNEESRVPYRAFGERPFRTPAHKNGPGRYTF
jgi:hypothetical protein